MIFITFDYQGLQKNTNHTHRLKSRNITQIALNYRKSPKLTKVTKTTKNTKIKKLPKNTKTIFTTFDNQGLPKIHQSHSSLKVT
jgi:hypothetical protein